MHILPIESVYKNSIYHQKTSAPLHYFPSGRHTVPMHYFPSGRHTVPMHDFPSGRHTVPMHCFPSGGHKIPNSFFVHSHGLRELASPGEVAQCLLPLVKHIIHCKNKTRFYHYRHCWCRPCTAGSGQRRTRRRTHQHYIQDFFCSNDAKR